MKMVTMKGKIMVVALLVAAFCFAAGVAVAEEPVSARALYEMDAAEAAKVYADKPVVVKGIAAKIGPNVYGLPSIELSDGLEGKTYVLCVLPYGDFFKLGDLKVGQELTISGEFRRGSVDGKSVLLKQSVVTEQ